MLNISNISVAIISKILSTYGEKYSSNMELLSLIEVWKLKLVVWYWIGAILTDLSEAINASLMT